MGVKINTSSIKNSRINPNISSDGLIFHIDSVYSEKSETNYLYDGFNLGAPGPGPLGSNKEYRRFTNLISDSSESFSILGTYAQTNTSLTTFSSSPTYSFGVNSFNHVNGFLTSGDYNPVYSIFEFGGTATPGTNIKLSMWGLSGTTSKIFDVFGPGGYTFSSTQSGTNLLLNLINNFVELPSGFTAANNYNYTDSKFLNFITQDIYGWKYEGNPSYLSSNSLGSGGFTFSSVNSFTWSAGVYGSYSSTQSIESVWTKSSSVGYTSRPRVKDENLSYYIETGNYRLGNYTDQAVWDLLDSDSPYSVENAFYYIGVAGQSRGNLVNISEDRLYHDNNLNRLFIPASTRTFYTPTQSYFNPATDIGLLLVYDTNINKLIGTVSYPGTASGFGGGEFISIDNELYLITPQTKIFYINKETMTTQLIFSDISINLPSYIKPFSFGGKKYALCSPETGNQYCFYQLSSTTASFLTFSKPETYNGWNLTPPLFNERTPVADVDISSESTFQVTGGASWSRFYVPAYGWTSSSPNPQISFLFIYQISESGGQLSIGSLPIDVIEFPDTKINRIYKIPDNSETWSTNFLPHNRDRMYLFGSVNEGGRWNITGTFSTVSTLNVLIGVSQSQATSGLFKTGYLYDVTFYSTSGTYSSTWKWDADPVTSGLPSSPGVSQFTSMTSSISGNNYFRFHRRSTVGIDDNGDSVIATFSEFTQLRDDFNSGGSMSMSISANSNNYWTLRKSTIDRGGTNSFTSPFNDYITLEEPASPKFGYDDIGWKCLGNYNNFFYTNGDYIRTTQQTNNVDRYFTQPSSNFVKFIYDDVNYIQPDINISGVNANKNSIYTLIYGFSFSRSYDTFITSATSVKLLETTLQYQSSASTDTTTGYIDLPNFGWQGINKGLTNKKKIDRTTPVWDEGSISLWFYNKDIIGTSSTFQSLFSCWEPIKRNQGTTELGSAPVYTRSTTQMSMNTEFFFGLGGNFNNNGSTITIKSRTFTTHYRPDINGSFNFTPGWYNISVSRSSSGLKVYLNGVRLSVFTGSSESSHSTSTLINTSGFNEKNSFFLNRRDARVIVGGYRQLTTGNTGGLGRTYDNIPINLFNGFFGMISVWRKELTDSEVMSNYNSFKNRFS
jgi:hypothetical protein